MDRRDDGLPTVTADPQASRREEEASRAPAGGLDRGTRERGGHSLLLIGAVILLFQVLLAAGVFTTTPHDGGDNAGYLTLAYSLIQRGAYLDLYDPAEPPHTKYPPAYPLLLAGAMLVGARSWAVFKIMSAALVAVSVLAVFAWASARKEPVYGAAVASLLALSDAYLWSSRWILSDPMFVVLTFLALAALERWGAGCPGSGWRRWGLPALGGLGAILAYFTRSAGLPLVIAVLAWLALRHRWRAAAAFAAAFLVPASLWWNRSRMLGGNRYFAEFGMVDPYDPSLGFVDATGLIARVLENVWLYAGVFIPAGLTGYGGWLFVSLGLLLVLLATVGWWRRARSQLRVGELFVPLYTGLILLWPVVWSGDRFALPLFPFVLFYAGESWLALAGRFGRSRRWPRMAAGILAVLVLGGPSAWVWKAQAESASTCRALEQALGPFACQRAGAQEFAAAALWSGSSLPDSAVVLSRKPRIFFLLSARKSLNYPMSSDAALLVETAEGAGAQYVLLDQVDSVADYYLFPIVRSRPELFCVVASWGDPDGVQTQLLRLPHDEVRAPVPEESAPESATVLLRTCPSITDDARWADPQIYTSAEIPLLTGLDR